MTANQQQTPASGEATILPAADGVVCPNCDYDLRGATHTTCPECGQEFDPQQVLKHRRIPWEHERALRWVLVGLCLWWVMQFALHPNWLTGAADRIDTIWIKLVFLNMPLQIALAGAGACLLEFNNLATRQRGGYLILAVVVLIAGQIVTGLATC